MLGLTIKILAGVTLALIGARLLLLPRFEELKKKIDRVVNATLIAILIVMIGRAVLYFLHEAGR